MATDSDRKRSRRGGDGDVGGREAEMWPCPECENVFVPTPGECPDCGTPVPATDPTTRDKKRRVRSYRLNRLGAAGGVALAGLLTGAASWFTGSPLIGTGLFLAALVAAGGLMLWR